jgi:hypothetical protein
MHMFHPRHFAVRAVLLAFACLAGAAVSYGSDTYDAATHQLAIPELQFGNATYWNMVITPGKVLAIAGGVPMGFWDAYAFVFPGGFELIAPSVVVGPTTFTNVTATIADMNSVGSVSGADSYDGTYLYIPSVSVGGKIYNYVVITVSGIDSLGNGFPKTEFDTYNTSTHQLSIPGVEVGAKAYTNVNVTVGNIVSVNGSGSVPGGANASTCYNPTYYATGTTMDLFYEDYTVGAASALEEQSVVAEPSTFNGVANAVGIQTTTISSQGTSTATEYYDITSKFPILLELGLGAPSGNQVLNPGDQFGGALSYGQSLQTSGNYVFTGGSETYASDYVFEGLEDVTVPAGTFHGACKWSLANTFGTEPTGRSTTWNSHQGVLLQNGTQQLQAGSKFNGAPVGP